MVQVRLKMGYLLRRILPLAWPGSGAVYHFVIIEVSSFPNFVVLSRGVFSPMAPGNGPIYHFFASRVFDFSRLATFSDFGDRRFFFG